MFLKLSPWRSVEANVAGERSFLERPVEVGGHEHEDHSRKAEKQKKTEQAIFSRRVGLKRRNDNLLFCVAVAK